MNAAAIIRSRGAVPRIDAEGNLALDLSHVPKSLRAEVVGLAKAHKTDIINELGGEPSGSPRPSLDAWTCPLGHVESWTSDHGLRICAKCHPRPRKGGGSWLQ